MAVLRRAKELHELEDLERAKLEIVRRRYADAPTPESKAEYLRLLRRFADLVMRFPVPPPAEGQPHLSPSNVNDLQA
ncbi:MAG TPA: hypothetical protein VKB88_10695 [Bryobacteraceae bacterium]|nr:hypothetical protein [Bryobacteraceae bacterium]